MLLYLVPFIHTFMDDCNDLANPAPPVDYHPGLNTMKEVENILKNDKDITASPVKVVKEKVAETEAIDPTTGEVVSVLENVGDKTGDFLKNVGSKLKDAKESLEENVSSTIKSVIDDAAKKVSEVKDDYVKKTEELGEKAKDIIDREVLTKMNEGEITRNLEEKETEALGGIKGLIDRADELLNGKLKENVNVVEKTSTAADGEVTTTETVTHPGGKTETVTHSDGTTTDTVKVKHPEERTVVTVNDDTGTVHTDKVIESPDKTSADKTPSDKPKETIEKKKETLPDGTKTTTEVHKKEEPPKETTTAVNGVHTDTLLDKLQKLRDKFKKHADLDVQMNSVGDDVYYPKIETLIYELAGLERDMEKMKGG
ncbi:hypothetical protein THOM_3177 [Trachipleistophora hominis]|uniref:Uncharacterized protein n=1 Tax=Trachipleistophora hominis TaxID=72359 RepID=L7JR33_TRAHO|nr:hypothetical protein THOM_3177 [Trachipleistophora hominis]